MQSTSRVHNAADLAGLQRKSGILKLLLHVAASKVAEVAPLPSRGAVGLGQGQLSEGNGAGLDALFESLQGGEGFLLGAGDLGLSLVVSDGQREQNERSEQLSAGASPEGPP